MTAIVASCRGLKSSYTPRGESIVKNADAKKLATESLYELAIRALGRRSHTSAELERKLRARAARAESVDTVLKRLSDQGYLDDARVAESHSHYRREYESLGRRRVLAELRRRGIERETAEKIVEETYAESDELELIRSFLHRKLGSRIDEIRIDDRKHLGRLYRSLARAGFSTQKIIEALGNLSSDSEWLEAMSTVEEVGE